MKNSQSDNKSGSVRILLLGKDGQLGQPLSEQLRSEYELISWGRDELDLTETSQIKQKISSVDPDIIVNTAAYTNVEKAEDEVELANIVNNVAVSEIAIAARDQDALLIHFSTDYVFSGKGHTAFKEDDETRPLNIYGKTKLAGEKAILRSKCEYLIFRISWLYSYNSKNFVTTVLDRISEDQEVSIVNDQFGCPTSTSYVARIVAHALKKGKPTSGVYHLTAKGKTNWYEFAKLVCFYASQHCHFDAYRKPRIKPIKSSEYHTKVKRPECSALDCNKLFLALGISQTSFEALLQNEVRNYLQTR